MAASPRSLVALLASCVSCVISVLLGIAAWRAFATNDAELIARYRGSAYEDAFGFGFWPTWSLLLLAQAALLALAWRFLFRGTRRVLLPVLLAAFAVASFLDYRSFQHLHALWSAQAQPQVSK